jgi:hypothetical protein
MSSSSYGYRRKPFWIYAVATLFVLTPFLHLMLTIKSAGAVDWYAPSSWWNWVRFLDPAPAVISTLLCLAGLAILFVRRWAWWLGMIALSSLCIYNIALISYSFADDPVTRLLATIGSFLLLILLFYSDFKKPFFNQRMRWWETDPRFKVSIPVKIQGLPAQALLVDISKSGLHLEEFIEGKGLQLPAELVVEVNEELHLNCSFSRQTPKGAAYQIMSMTKHQARYLKRWIHLLSKDPSNRVR